MRSERSTAVIIGMLCLAAGFLRAEGTGFTYQGWLNDNGRGASGIYQLRFTLHAAESGGGVLAGPINASQVAVSNGLFTAMLDFGDGLFDGQRRWLEIAVATNGADAFTVLTPRQEIRPAPYAIRAGQLDGPVHSNALAGAYCAPVAFVNPENVFAGDGGGLTNVQATTLDGLTGAAFWQLGGNSGISNNFLGTLDGEPLELRVNNRRGLRLEPGFNGSVNIVAGNGGAVFGATSGSTIAGGVSNVVQALEDPVTEGGTIGGGAGNVLASAAYSTVSGGAGNAVFQGAYGSIAGGSSNILGLAPGEYYASHHGFIGGGFGNSILDGGYSLIAGGGENQIRYFSDYATVGGGFRNVANSATWATTIAGGEANVVSAGAFTSTRGTTIAGGTENQAAGQNSTVSGGEGNHVWARRRATIGGGGENVTGAESSTIGGGSGNFIFGDDLSTPQSPGATIGGGRGNSVSIGGLDGTIAGGTGNTIIGADPGSRYRAPGATIGGGSSNLVTGSYGTVPGGNQAVAENFGQFAYASGSFATAGDAQTSVYVCRGATSDGTQTDLFLDGASRRISLPNNSTWTFEILVTGRAANGASAAYRILGAAKNKSGLTTIFGKLRQKVIGEDDSTWDATAAASGADNTLAIQVTGATDTSIRWVATVRTSEVTY